MPGEKLIQTANIWLSCTKYAISAELLWWVSLVHGGVSKLQKYQQVWKKWKFKCGIVASAFKALQAHAVLPLAARQQALIPCIQICHIKNHFFYK